MRLEIGKHYLVRTVNRDYVGRLKEVDSPYHVTLEQASWVAESGRWSVFMAQGRAAGMEVEPAPGLGMLRHDEVWEWPHPLFTEAHPA